MKYVSTRGGVAGLTFEDAVYTGYASDGGLVLPEEIPTVNRLTLQSWAKLSYIQLAKVIIPMFVSEDEIPLHDLNNLLDKAFSTFSNPEIAPIRKLPGDLCIQELFYGVTWAFKDLALSCLGQMLEYFLSKRQRHLTVLVGTSGDTGSAAIEAVKGQKWVDIIVLLPKGRCSKTQELQMTTVLEDNIHVYRVDGTSDDLDKPIKDCFSDHEFAQQHNLSSINSINWARIMIQMVHYFYAYLQMCPACDKEVEIVIPTGACGNVTAGCLASMMGLPVKLVCAVTENDIVARTLTHGDFSISKEVVTSLSTAIDIQVPYNMERMWYLFSGGDHKLVSRLMMEFENNGKVKVPDDLAAKIQKVIVGTYVASVDIVKATMRRCWQETGYLLCPHTAVGVAYHYHSRTQNPEAGNTVTRVCIATASVAKFQEAVLAAGLVPVPSAEVAALALKKTRYQDMNKGDNWEEILRKKIISISSKIEART